MNKPTFVFYSPTPFVLDGEEYDVGTYYTQRPKVVKQVRSFAETRRVFKRGEKLQLEESWINLDQDLIETTEVKMSVKDVETTQTAEMETKTTEVKMAEASSDDVGTGEEVETVDSSVNEELDEEINELEELDEEINDFEELDEDIDEELIDEFVENVSTDEKSEDNKNENNK